MASKVAERAEIARQDKWSLSDIFRDDGAWEAAYARAEEAARAFSGREGTLASEDALEAALCEYFALNRAVEALFTYARMKRDEDNRQTSYQALCDRAQTLAVAAETAAAFFVPELLALPEAFLRAAAQKPALADYSVFLAELSRRRPHTLSAELEKMAAMAGEMGSAPHNIYSMLTQADLKFPVIRGEDGEEVEITSSGFIPLMMSRQRAVREAAFEGLYSTYQKYSATIPAIYAASVKADIFYARAAKHPSALASRLFPDNIPESVYENLIAAVRAHLPTLNRFVLRNGRLIGVEKMSVVDLYVPAIEDFDIKLSFDEAYELVIDCLRPLGEDYQALLRRARAERWLDVYENAGKSPGAYSWGTYDSHPYVLLNYKENLDSALTIAHEMGHAMHSYHSNAAQPYPKADYSLFVAEVASTCNEILVLMALMDRYADDRAAQAFLAYHLLDGFRTTVFRQTMFAEFERDAHAMAERGEPLTAESLNALYGGLNGTYYAGLEQHPLLSYEWMRIPHFYRAFYVYKYATGFSAAMALATAIRREGAPAVARYKKFLALGGSLYPIDALKVAGVDMLDPASVAAALDEFDRLVERYEALTQ